MVVPSGSTDDDTFVGANAGLGIGDNGGGRREVEYRVERGEEVSRQSAGIRVIRSTEDLHVVTALAGDVRDQGAGLAAAKDEEMHGTPLTAECAEIAEKVRGFYHCPILNVWTRPELTLGF